jgi:site-specific recombinase XerD
VGLSGNYSSHTLRKTFGYTLRTEHKLPLEIIQKLYGHSSGAITLNYVSIQADELHDAYMLGI